MSVFCARLKANAGKMIMNAHFEAKFPKMIYGHNYAFFIMDEAHSACKHNLAHMAAHAVCEHAVCEHAIITVAMMATSIMTKPQASLHIYLFVTPTNYA